MKILISAILFTVVSTAFLGFIYPLAITGISQHVFPGQANGSIIRKDGVIIGSALIGQEFTNAHYFHGRPSAVDYNAGNSGGYNFGPLNDAFRAQVSDRIAAIRREEMLSSNGAVSADRVLASASGLDPHISMDAACEQSMRIARTRNMTTEYIRSIIDSNAERRYILFGEMFVNVLKLNLALDLPVTNR
ncbi:MAG: potassium-transporting ATPase subunit KdpC [Spirochaetota bacterium]